MRGTRWGYIGVNCWFVLVLIDDGCEGLHWLVVLVLILVWVVPGVLVVWGWFDDMLDDPFANSAGLLQILSFGIGIILPVPSNKPD